MNKIFYAWFFGIKKHSKVYYLIPRKYLSVNQCFSELRSILMRLYSPVDLTVTVNVNMNE